MLPSSVQIREVGVREGFQQHRETVPTALKLEIINSLSESGLSSIEVTSFVRPDRVPQLADAAEVAAALAPSSSCLYTALYLNQQGFLRAIKHPLLHILGWIPIALSERFLIANNNISMAQSLAQIADWEQLFSLHSRQLHGLMVSTCFGTNWGGILGIDALKRTLDAVFARLSQPPQEICLADTMGWGNPALVAAYVGYVRDNYPQVQVSLHLHDTRGLGVVNAYAGLLAGVEIFETSIAGVGGCPFAEGASGNVATEAVVFLCEQLGIKTGVDLLALQHTRALMAQASGLLPSHLFPLIPKNPHN